MNALMIEAKQYSMSEIAREISPVCADFSKLQSMATCIRGRVNTNTLKKLPMIPHAQNIGLMMPVNAYLMFSMTDTDGGLEKTSKVSVPVTLKSALLDDVVTGGEELVV